MAILKRRTKVAVLLAVVAALVSKRRYPKASLATLFKRLIGFIFSRTVPIPTPQIVSGRGKSKEIAKLLTDRRCKKPLIVTDKVLMSLGLVKPVIDSLQSQGFQPEVYDDVKENPPSELVEEGYEIYKNKSCDSIIAFGGGSPMDVAKVIGAKVANPSPSVEAYQGFFMCTRMGLRPLPPLIAVPTTAGTGSETTIAAVITIKQKNAKIAIADLGLVPSVAVLDPELLIKLPKGVTSATGMDALTHAVESYIGGWSSTFSRSKSLAATQNIVKHLVASHQDGSNLEAREALLNASFDAGLAFTRANVGYVHAIAHQFGGMFHTPHGVANAMLLPHVLSFYLKDEGPESGDVFCSQQFCELANEAGIVSGYTADSVSPAKKREIAQKFVDRIAEMNKTMDIPSEVKGMEVAHVDQVATRALKEAHGDQHSLLSKPVLAALDLGYPVPKYMTHDECKEIIAMVLPAAEKAKWKS
jgi:alcohol dehydrogenase class IV